MSAQVYANLESLLALRFHVKHKRLNHQQKLISAKGGYHQAVRKGRGMEFHEVREYVAGDEIRHIDWKVSARTQKVHTKVFTEELERPVICLVEQTPRLFFGSQQRFKSVQALNILSTLSWITLHQGDRLGGWVFNHQQQHWVDPKHRQQSAVHLIESALQLQQQLKEPKLTPFNWIQQLDQLKNRLKAGSRLFLIGDFLEADKLFFAKLTLLKKHLDLTLIHIYDPLEKQLPQTSLPAVLKLTNGHQILEIDAHTQQHYQQTYQKAWQTLWQQSHQLHIPLIEISTQEDPIAALIQQGVIH